MTSPPRPRRSALYMPAANIRAIEKARELPCDVVILDLEDAVAPEAKDMARSQAVAAASAGQYGKREVVIRANGLGTQWAERDIAAIAVSGAHALMMPKIQSAGDVAELRALLDRYAAPAELELWLMIETPLGILNAREIAAIAAGNRYPVTVLVLGTNDLAKETRAEQTADRLPMLAWLSQCVLVARAYGLDILDSVYNDFRNLDGFAFECAQARSLGFDGKTCIHPSQIEIANKAFAPDPDEVAWSRRIVAAFEEPQNRAKGAINIDGRMVELMHRDIARRTLALADAIGTMKSS